MTLRVTTRLLIDSLGRRIRAEGGHLTILAKGDETAGTIVFLLCERGKLERIVEPTRDVSGDLVLADCGPQEVENSDKINDYLERRRARDPDLWLIELDIAEAERFAAETIRAR